MKIIIAIIFIFSISYIGGYWLKNKDASGEYTELYFSNCDLLKAPCEVAHSGYKYLIQFDGEPSPLKPFNVKLITQQQQPEMVEIEFYMQAMDMGYNQYPLKFEKDAWQAQVILPVCSLGSNEWILKVKASYKGLIHLTQLKFKQ